MRVERPRVQSKSARRKIWKIQLHYTNFDAFVGKKVKTQWLDGVESYARH